MTEHGQERQSEEAKTYNPDIWGFVTFVIAFIAFAVTHFSFGFPDLLIHVLILPVIIGFVVRWLIKLKYTNVYCDD